MSLGQVAHVRLDPHSIACDCFSFRFSCAFRESNTSSILFANVDGEIYAVEDMCSHEDASLYNGALKGRCVECPLHGSHFDLKTGEPQQEPATEAIKTFSVKVENEQIWVQV